MKEVKSMMNLDTDKMNAIIQQAFDKAQGSRRWQTAIVRAKIELASNPYLHWNGHALVIMSSTSSEIYEANGQCQCKAFVNSQPCWHRAASRLVERYLEAEAAPEPSSTPHTHSCPKCHWSEPCDCQAAYTAREPGYACEECLRDQDLRWANKFSA